MRRLHRCRFRRRTTGFTLTELVFAMLVLTVGMVPIICMLIVSQRVSQQAQVQRVAYNVARYELEQVTSESFVNCAGGLSNCNAVSERSFTIPSNLTGTLPHGVVLTGTYAITTTSSASLRQVSVLVRWSSVLGNSVTNSPSSEVRLSTLVAEQPGP